MEKMKTTRRKTKTKRRRKAFLESCFHYQKGDGKRTRAKKKMKRSGFSDAPHHLHRNNLLVVDLTFLKDHPVVGE
jgi:hypothetical protein